MPALDVGHRFERYRILRQLGGSISGESYAAEDIVLQRTVALKLIRPGIILPEAARRQFFREMQGISELSHPSLAAILDYGEAEGQLYVARRLVEAGSLLSTDGRTWYRPPLAVKDAITYTYQLAQALQYIHNYDYVHGGFSFSNVLVLRKPQAEQDSGPFLIADIGIAYFARRFGQLQTPISTVTAAPEQRAGRVTAASDQYALAVVLFFWLSGRPPFVGSAEEIEQMKLNEALPALSRLNPQVTLEQEALLRQALKVSPEQRHASIIEFAEALLASLAHPVTVAVSASSGAATLVAEQEPPAEPQPRPEGGPRPQVTPDIPQPPIEPAPIPPEPQPPVQPAPEPTPPEPEPAEPVVLPQPAPDIIVPIPEPAPPPPEKPAKKAESSAEELTARSARYVTAATFTITSPYSSTPREELLDREVTTLGRAGSSDILLDYDTFTSRHHALVKRIDGYYTIYDRKSAYGTMVNDEPLTGEEGHRLAEGDVLRIGVYELVFHLKTVPQ